MVFNLLRKIILATTLSGCCYIALSQKTIGDLKASLDKTVLPGAKADICFDIADRYANSLKVDSSIFFANKTKEYSEQGNYETGIGKYHLVMTQALALRSHYAEAKENASKAIEIFIRQKEKMLLGRGYLSLANVQYISNSIATARQNYWTAISIFEPVTEANGLYACYWWMARSYYKTSEIDSAASYFIKALSMAERLNDPDRILVTGCWVGRSFLSLGEWDKAARYFDHGLGNRGPQTDKVLLRGCLRDYAICLAHTHDFVKSDSVIKEIVSVNAQLKDSYGMAVMNRLNGTVEYEKKNYRQAIADLQLANRKMVELKIANSETKDIVLLLGKAEYEMNSYDSAVIHLRSAITLSKESGALTDEEEADILISKSFQQIGNADSALHYFKSYTVLKDSIFSRQKQKTIIEVTAKYETGKKEQEIKILEKEKETNTYLLQLRNQQIEKQRLEADKKSQQLSLASQQTEISRLEASQKTLALENQQKEMIKKQNELVLLGKENELQAQRKNFAYIAIAAILLFSGYMFYRYVQNKKLSRRLSSSLKELKEAQEQLVKTEKEKEADNIRVRISRDIHDEVGATLSGVALFSEIARQKMQQHQENEAQVYLDHITANSKEMVEKMSDIVWTINPKNDSFDRIIAKLQSYAVNLCAGKGIRLHLNIDDAVLLYNPPMQVRRNIYLFLKEAINNAVKYSEGRNIFLLAHKEQDSMTIEVKDDGKGFDKKQHYEGNGLNNMQARAKDIGAVFTIESGNGVGTAVRLQFDFHPEEGQ